MARGPCPARIVDIGGGAGAGLLTAAPSAPTPAGADRRQPEALRLARINAAVARESRVDTVQTDRPGGRAGPSDLVLANPPYILDRPGATTATAGPARRPDSLRLGGEAVARLAPGRPARPLHRQRPSSAAPIPAGRLAPAAAAAAARLATGSWIRTCSARSWSGPAMPTSSGSRWSPRRYQAELRPWTRNSLVPAPGGTTPPDRPPARVRSVAVVLVAGVLADPPAGPPP